MRFLEPEMRVHGDLPGEPPKSESAGMTVLGGTTVLSAILAQSFMIVNFPYSRTFPTRPITSASPSHQWGARRKQNAR